MYGSSVEILRARLLAYIDNPSTFEPDPVALLKAYFSAAVDPAFGDTVEDALIAYDMESHYYDHADCGIDIS